MPGMPAETLALGAAERERNAEWRQLLDEAEDAATEQRGYTALANADGTAAGQRATAAEQRATAAEQRATAAESATTAERTCRTADNAMYAAEAELENEGACG